MRASHDRKTTGPCASRNGRGGNSPPGAPRDPASAPSHEVSAFLTSLAALGRMNGLPGLMARLLYGSGLRLLACCRLRVKDLDFGRPEIVVREGKGGRDRRTMLPAGLHEILKDRVERARELHRRNAEAGAGWVEPPFALRRKYVNAGREVGWQWVFPATRRYVDAETGERRRHHDDDLRPRPRPRAVWRSQSRR